MNAPRTTPRRFRGWLYLATHGPDDSVRAVTVATSWSAACAALAGWPDGDIVFVAPGDGRSLRKYLADGPPPLSVPMQRIDVNPVTLIAERARCSKPTARTVLARVLADHGGSGAEIFCAVEAIKASPRGRVKFSELTGGAPV